MEINKAINQSILPKVKAEKNNLSSILELSVISMLNDETKIQILPRYIQNSNSKQDFNNSNVYQNYKKK